MLSGESKFDAKFLFIVFNRLKYYLGGALTLYTQRQFECIKSGISILITKQVKSVTAKAWLAVKNNIYWKSSPSKNVQKSSVPKKVETLKK